MPEAPAIRNISGLNYSRPLLQALDAVPDIHEPFVREQEINPEAYFPDDYHPVLLPERPVGSTGYLVVPLDSAPVELTDGMGESSRRPYQGLVTG